MFSSKIFSAKNGAERGKGVELHGLCAHRFPASINSLSYDFQMHANRIRVSYRLDLCTYFDF